MDLFVYVYVHIRECEINILYVCAHTGYQANIAQWFYFGECVACRYKSGANHSVCVPKSDNWISEETKQINNKSTQAVQPAHDAHLTIRHWRWSASRKYSIYPNHDRTPSNPNPLFLNSLNVIIHVFVRMWEFKRKAECVLEAGILCIHSFGMKTSLGLFWPGSPFVTT